MNTLLENVVAAGRNRWIPSICDRTWCTQTNISPVADSLTYEAEFRSAVHSGNMVGVLVFGFFGAFILSIFSGYFMAPAARAGWPGWVITALGIIFLIAALGCGAPHNTTAKMPDISSIDKFWKSYSNLIGWSGKTPLELAQLDEAQLKYVGKAILVAVATRKEQLGIETDPDKMVEHTISVGQLSDEFKNKYEVLASLGLASGGFGSYYVEAEKLAKLGKAA